MKRRRKFLSVNPLLLIRQLRLPLKRLLILLRKNIQVDPEFVEKRVVHYGDRYAGTLDAVALIDGKLGILDIKTSQAIYRDYNLQTSAYIAALHSSLNNLQTRWILRIDQTKICLKCGAVLRSKGGRDKIRAPKVKIGVIMKMRASLVRTSR